MHVRRLLVGFSEQRRTRLTFLSPRRSKPLARTPTLITPFRTLGSFTREEKHAETKRTQNNIQVNLEKEKDLKSKVSCNQL